MAPLLTSGANGLGCSIARGWFGEGGGMGTMIDTPHLRSMILKLSLHYRSGSKNTVLVSSADGNWTTASGPYLKARIFQGVEYDAGRETPGWTSANFSEDGQSSPLVRWSAVRADPTVPAGMELRSAMTPLIRHTNRFPAVNFTVLPPAPPDVSFAARQLQGQQQGRHSGPSARYLFDFGQNAAAQISLHLARQDSATATALPLLEPAAAVTFSLAFAESSPLDPPAGIGLGVGGGSPIVYHTSAARLVADGIDWSPHFTYNGFQFCTLTVSSNSSSAADFAALPVPTIATLTSHFTHSDVDHNRSFIKFNLPLLNKIQHMTRYASKSNLLDVPTDCPTRERAGWTGDGGLTREVTSYNFDMAAFYRKWQNDIGDAQATFRHQCETQMFPGRPTIGSCDCFFRNCTGEVPPAAPWYQHGYHGGKDPQDGLNMPGTDPAWGMAWISISHLMLTWHADIDAVRRHYPGLRLYIEYLSRIPGVDPAVPPFTDSALLTYNVYADWDKPTGTPDADVITGGNNSHVPNPTRGPRNTPSPIIGSWVMIKSLGFMVDIATALGRADDASEYKAMAKRSAAAFLAAYLRADAEGRPTFADGALTQMSAISLGLDLFSDGGEHTLSLEPGVRTAVQEALSRAVVRAGYHSLSGIIGQAPLFPVLSRASWSSKPPSAARASSTSQPSLAALALQINVKETYPSFGYEIANGATTLWEMLNAELL